MRVCRDGAMHGVAIDFKFDCWCGRRAVARIVDAATFRAPAAAPAPVLAFWLFFAPAPPNTSRESLMGHGPRPRQHRQCHLHFAAEAQPAPLAKPQLDALNTYENALSQFKSILRERRAQINSKHNCRTCGTSTLSCSQHMISAYKILPTRFHPKSADQTNSAFLRHTSMPK